MSRLGTSITQKSQNEGNVNFMNRFAELIFDGLIPAGVAVWGVGAIIDAHIAYKLGDTGATIGHTGLGLLLFSGSVGHL